MASSNLQDMPEGSNGHAVLADAASMAGQVAAARHLRTIVDATPQAVFAKDLRGRYTFVNPVLAARIGLPPAEIVGRTAEELGFEPGIGSSELEAEVARTGERGELEISVGVSEGAPTQTLIIQKFPLRDEAGRIVGVGGVAIDITQLRGMQAQLERVRHQETLGKLAGGLAHDFNNLLSVILNFSRFVLDDLNADQEAQRRDLREVIGAAERAATLANRLVVFAGDARPVGVHCEPSQVLTEFGDRVGRLAGPTVEVDLEIAPAGPEVAISREDLEEMVEALVRNAVEAMPAGGRLALSFEPADAGAVLVVADTGTGMAPATLERATEPFFTTRGNPARGLGLATTSGLVRRAGGRLEVVSAPGEGTTVTVRLPWVRDRVPAAGAVPAGTAATTVLVVDDEDGVRAVAERILRRGGYRVLSASTAEEARRLAQDGTVDLLLSDIVMPEASGPELARSLPQVPCVVFMSGFAEQPMSEPGDREWSGFLHKPFTAEELLGAVAAGLNADEVGGDG